MIRCPGCGDNLTGSEIAGGLCYTCGECLPDDIESSTQTERIEKSDRWVAPIIGLGHHAGSGKDALAEILVREHGFVRLAFADPLRAVVKDTNPVVRRLVDQFGWEYAKRHYSAPRRALETTGKACRRVLGGDVFIRSVFSKMEQDGRYVISDCRWPLEAEAILSAGGLLVKVTRPGAQPQDTESDHALDGFDGWDAEIVNDGSLDDLSAKAEELLRRWSLTPASHGRAFEEPAPTPG